MRKAMVTRTIVTTVATAMCVDTTTAEVCNKTVEVARTHKTEESLLKAVKAVIETEELKVVSIVDKYEKETLYGMTEDDFIANAKELPPRTNKKEE